MIFFLTKQFNAIFLLSIGDERFYLFKGITGDWGIEQFWRYKSVADSMTDINLDISKEQRHCIVLWTELIDYHRDGLDSCL